MFFSQNLMREKRYTTCKKPLLAYAHEAQLINYLKATQLEVGMLLNFGRIAQFKRKVLTKRWKNLKK
jgi:GxxExxY protein